MLALHGLDGRWRLICLVGLRPGFWLSRLGGEERLDRWRDRPWRGRWLAYRELSRYHLHAKEETTTRGRASDEFRGAAVGRQEHRAQKRERGERANSRNTT
eukprot:3086339-Rhodomonas_salina.2